MNRTQLFITCIETHITEDNTLVGGLLSFLLPDMLCVNPVVALPPKIDLATETQLIIDAIVSNLVASSCQLDAQGWYDVLLSVHKLGSIDNNVTKLARVSLALNLSLSGCTDDVLDIVDVVPGIIARDETFHDIPPVVLRFLSCQSVQDAANAVMSRSTEKPALQMIVCDNFDKRYRGFACLNNAFVINGENFDNRDADDLCMVDLCTLIAHGRMDAHMRLNARNFLATTPGTAYGYQLEQKIWGLVPKFYSPRNVDKARILASAILANISTGKLTIPVSEIMKAGLVKFVGARAVLRGVGMDKVLDIRKE